MLPDYETLRLIWWVLLGVLIIGFAVTDGFDFGVAMLVSFLGRTNAERRVIINTIGPIWEGNQVWFILGGGSIFAAWPMLYSLSFSGFYLAMIIALAGFILRPVSFKYRSKVNNEKWRHTWDILLFCSGIIPPLIFGIAVGNVIQGIPFYFDQTLRSFYTGNFFELFNPFALLCSFLSLSMFCMHGSLYLTNKTNDPILTRAKHTAQIFAFISLLLFLIGGFWIAYSIKGYVLTQTISPEGYSNPLNKSVILQIGAWLANYKQYHWMLAAPILGLSAAFFAIIFSQFKWFKIAFIASGLSIIGIISSVGFSLFPFLLPSSIAPQDSLLVWDSSSSQLTLFIMLIATAIFLPLIILYTGWIYRVFRGKVLATDIEQDSNNFY